MAPDGTRQLHVEDDDIDVSEPLTVEEARSLIDKRYDQNNCLYRKQILEQDAKFSARLAELRAANGLAYWFEDVWYASASKGKPLRGYNYQELAGLCGSSAAMCAEQGQRGDYTRYD